MIQTNSELFYVPENKYVQSVGFEHYGTPVVIALYNKKIV